MRFGGKNPVLHADSGRAGWEDWGIPGRGMETKQEGKKTSFSTSGGGQVLPKACCTALPDSRSSCCLRGGMAGMKRSLFTPAEKPLQRGQIPHPSPESPCVKREGRE